MCDEHALFIRIYDMEVWKKNIHQLHDLPKLHANVQILNQAPMYVQSIFQVFYT